MVQNGRADVEQQDMDGYTALIFAAVGGHLKVVSWLVEMGGVDVNKQDKNGFTALTAAAFKGHAKVAEWLVREAKADTERQSKRGSTAAFVGHSQGHHQVAVLLLSLGAAPWPTASTKVRTAAAAVAQARRERCSDTSTTLASSLPPVSLRALVAAYSNDAIGALDAMWLGKASGEAGGLSEEEWEVLDAGDLLAW